MTIPDWLQWLLWIGAALVALGTIWRAVRRFDALMVLLHEIADAADPAVLRRIKTLAAEVDSLSDRVAALENRGKVAT